MLEKMFENLAFNMYVKGIEKLREVQKREVDLAKVENKYVNDYAYAIDVIIERAYKQYLSKLYESREDVNILSEHYSFPIREDARYFVMIDPVDGSRELMRDERAAWFIFSFGKWKGSNTQLKDIEGVIVGRLPTSKEEVYEVFTASREKAKKYVYKSFPPPSRPEKWYIEQLKTSSLKDIEHLHLCFVNPFPPYEHISRIADEFWKLAGKKVIFNEQYLTTAGQMIEVLEEKLGMIVDVRPSVNKKYEAGMLCAHPYDVPPALILKKAGAIITGKDLKEESFWNQKLYPLNQEIEFIVFPNKYIFDKYADVLSKAFEKL